jgi:hypothetical protein
VVELEEVTSPASRETVETVFECSQLWVTGLKPGVNEMGAFRLLRQGSPARHFIATKSPTPVF